MIVVCMNHVEALFLVDYIVRFFLVFHRLTCERKAKFYKIGISSLLCNILKSVTTKILLVSRE